MFVFMMIVTPPTGVSEPRPISWLILAADSRAETTCFGFVTTIRSFSIAFCRVSGSKASAHIAWTL